MGTKILLSATRLSGLESSRFIFPGSEFTHYIATEKNAGLSGQSTRSIALRLKDIWASMYAKSWTKKITQKLTVVRANRCEKRIGT